MNLTQLEHWVQLLTGQPLPAGARERLRSCKDGGRLLTALAEPSMLNRVRFRFTTGVSYSEMAILPSLTSLISALPDSDLPLTRGSLDRLRGCASHEEAIDALRQDPLLKAQLYWSSRGQGGEQNAELAARAFDAAPITFSLGGTSLPLPPDLNAVIEEAWDNEDLPTILKAYGRWGDALVSEGAAKALLICGRAFQLYGASQTAYLIALQIRHDQRLLGRLATPDRRLRHNLEHAAAARSGLKSEAFTALALWQAESAEDWRPHVKRALLLADAHSREAEAECEAAARLIEQLPAQVLLFWGNLRAAHGDLAGAQVLYDCVAATEPAEAAFALCQAAIRQGNVSEAQHQLAAGFAHFGLDLPPFESAASGRLFSLARTCGYAEASTPPVVSVIMPAFNAALTLKCAAQSVLDQTERAVELIIVDDASQDSTAAEIHDLVAADPRVRSMRLDINRGAYGARNAAIPVARGQFVTFHDADDWMHPNRLERHLQGMTENHVASRSQWLRMTAQGAPRPRHGGGYMHSNPASTFIRREALGRLGPFDPVRAGADTEFDARITRRFGPAGWVHLNQPLSLGLHQASSLTQGGTSAFDEDRFSASRLAYAETWAGQLAARGAAAC